MYCKSEDPYLSCRQYLENAGNLNLLFESTCPKALGFSTSIGQYISKNHECAELVIDSTHRTNSSKFELFTVICKTFGVGFPVACLFFEGNRDDVQGSQKRKDILSSFLNALKNSIPWLNPRYFFTDKDQGQISAIKSVYGITPSICLWHMKRAVRSKILALKRKEGYQFTNEFYMTLQTRITEHYCMHPIFPPGIPLPLLRLRAISEIQALLSRSEDNCMLNYLMENWYNEENFYLWGYRDVQNGIPSTRTTMLVEAHWRVLKRRFLISYSYPRMDFVTHVINTQMIPKYIEDYRLYINGLKKGDWWKQFSKAWKDLSSSATNNNYNTSLEEWWCSCPSFRTKNFQLCKHLCRLRQLPLYREVIRSRFPPFYRFQQESGRLFALLEGPLPRFASTTIRSAEVSQSTHTVTVAPVQLTLASNTLPSISLLKSTVAWFSAHIDELESIPAGSKQIEYLSNRYLPHLLKYSRNVETERGRRRPTPTWKRNPDTFYLP